MTLSSRTRLKILPPEQRAPLFRVLRDSDPPCNRPAWSLTDPSGCRAPSHPVHRPGHGYIPTERQSEILGDDHLAQLIWGGYRGGKSSVSCIKAALLTISFFQQHYDKADGQVAWIVGATYEKVRGEFSGPEYGLVEVLRRMWPAGVKASKDLAPGTISVATPCAIHPHGSTLHNRSCKNGTFLIKTKSAEDPTSINMEAPVWIIIAEAAHTTHEVYLRCASRVSEARSRFPGFGMLILEGTADTPDASLGWYAQLWKEWQTKELQEGRNARSFSLSSGSNTLRYPGGEDDPELLERKAQMPSDRYSEWHLGTPVPPSGRVFTDFNPIVHLQPWKYDPELPVYIGIDPGYSGQPSRYAVEVAQIEPDGTWRFFDEVFVEQTKTSEVINICKNKFWWGNKDKKFVIDIAGAANTGVTETHEDIWRKETGANLGHQRVQIMPGINRFAQMLRGDMLTGKPKATFDPRRCPGIIAELGGGLDPISGQPRVYSWMRNHQGEIVGRTPYDRYCDGIKAATYLMVGVLGYTETNSDRKTIRVIRHRLRRGVA